MSAPHFLFPRMSIYNELCSQETSQEAEGDNEQHPARDDCDGELDGQELRGARHQL